MNSGHARQLKSKYVLSFITWITNLQFYTTEDHSSHIPWLLPLFKNNWRSSFVLSETEVLGKYVNIYIAKSI
jgi:hypothetical protein